MVMFYVLYNVLSMEHVNSKAFRLIQRKAIYLHSLLLFYYFVSEVEFKNSSE